MMVHYQVRGLILDNHKTDLPVKKGLRQGGGSRHTQAHRLAFVHARHILVRGYK